MMFLRSFLRGREEAGFAIQMFLSVLAPPGRQTTNRDAATW